MLWIDKHTDTDKRFTPATVVGVSNESIQEGWRQILQSAKAHFGIPCVRP